ncbi:MAG TPA: acetoacetate decarboxylase family protein [Solirubrobacteraceae bacterium]|nr:acetoacetate decarboxylase family protein [Solirubrobacteraceae bacterium]
MARSLFGAVTHIADPRRIISSPAPAPAAPRYVDYGSLMTPPAPFHSYDTKLWGFWAQADEERIRQLLDRVFAGPTAGAVRCRALSHYVMITWGNIAKVVSATPPYDQRGGVAEPQVAIWIPVALRDPTTSHDRFAMCIPFIWLDNAMSLADGRELFGYPKSWGWPKFPADADNPKRWKLDAFGLNYDPDALAGRHHLLEVVQTESAVEGVEAELASLTDLARHAAGRLFEGIDVMEDFGLAESVVSDLFNDRLPNVFLKQFRSVQDGLNASLQQVVEADYKITRLSARPVLFEHELTVHQLDSHPVIDELGLESQTLTVAYEVEMDFDVGGGRVLWDSASR